jgi:outer membrane protein assembly factor BamB
MSARELASVALFCTLVFGLPRGLFGSPPAFPDAVTYQNDPEHDGSVTQAYFSSTPTHLWSTNLGSLLSYPLIAQGEVYVTAGDNSHSGMHLYALNAQTGHVDWSTALNSQYWSDSAAYDNGKIFLFNDNFTSSTMNAYDAASGALLWSKPLAPNYSFSSPPTARNGIVYVGGAGSGGTVRALRESDGAQLWTQSVQAGANSSPTVTADGVYVSYDGPETYKFNPTTGAQIWHYSTGLIGGGGRTSVYYNGNLYARDVESPFYANKNVAIFNASTGSSVRFFLDGYFTNPTAPAFSGGIGYLEVGGVLQAFDPANGNPIWSLQPSSGSFVTAPIVVNGVVFEGTGGGNVYALDGASGATLSITAVGAAINGPDEQNVSQPLTGLGAGDGLLVVPAGTTLNVYTITPEPASLASAIVPLALICLRRRRPCAVVS